MVETWYGSPTPPYASNHKLMTTEQEKSLPSGERVGWPRVGGKGWALGWGPGRNLTVAQMGPLSGTGTRGAGGRSGPLGRLGAPFPQAWPCPPRASLSLFPSHLRPQGGGPGSPDQPFGRADRTAGKQGKVTEPSPLSLHSPQIPREGRVRTGVGDRSQGALGSHRPVDCGNAEHNTDRPWKYVHCLCPRRGPWGKRELWRG